MAKNIIIIELADEFKGVGEVAGIIFRKVRRGKATYIYECGPKENPYYEVFEVKTSQVCLDFVNHVYSDNKFKERYPKAKDFGKWAWTYRSLEQALAKYFELEGKISQN